MPDRIKRDAYKLIEELNKLKAHVPLEVWAEICKTIKVVSLEGYTLPHEDNYAEMAERIQKEAEKKIANRRKYQSYSNMNENELVRAWCSKPNLRIEFSSNFQWFVNCIIETFPDSSVQEFLSYTVLKEFSQEHLARMIHDYEQKQASEQIKGEGKPEDADQLPITVKGNRLWNYFLDLYERTSKAFFDSVLGKYGPK